MSRRASDVVVVGAGPAGLAAALALRSLGLDVRVIERRRPGADGALDKACGEGLMPDGLDRLEELGLERAALGGRPFYGIRYLDAAGVAEGRFRHGTGLGVRRTELHRSLSECVRGHGIEIEWGRAVDALRRKGDGFVLESAGETLESRFLVAADGLRSRLRRAAGLERSAREDAPRFGLRQHFEIEPWSDLVEVYWSEGCEAYVTPLARRLVGVAILWRPRRSEVAAASVTSSPFARRLVPFPALVERLAAARTVGRTLGVGPLRQRVSARARGNLFLVGDAAGYRDAVTGEGMSLAFHQASALRSAMAEALARGRPGVAARHYAAATRRSERLPGAITEVALLLSRHPALRRRAIAALGRRPEYFDRLLAVLTHELPLRGLGLRSTARFGLELLRAAANGAIGSDR